MVDTDASYSLKLFSPCNGREAGDWCEHSLRVRKNIKRLLVTQEKEMMMMIMIMMKFLTYQGDTDVKDVHTDQPVVEKVIHR